MNQRKAGTVLSYVHILVTNTISLIYTPYMLRMMGQSEYGLYGSASSLIGYLSVLSFGLAGAYVRYNAMARARGDREEEKRINGMFLVIYSALALLVLVGGVCISALSGELVKRTFSNEEMFKLRVLVLILTLNMMLTFICNVFMMALQAYEKFFFIRIVLLLAGIIQPIINVAVLRSGGRSIAITVTSLCISSLTYLAMFIYARKAIRFEVSLKGFKKNEFRELFVFSSYLFLNSITNQLTFSSDNVILSAVKGTSAVAIYSVGSSFKEYFQNFSSSISSVFAPEINRIVVEGRDFEKVDALFRRVGRIQFYVVSLILIGYCSIGHSFIRLWAGTDYGDGFYIGLLLMIAVFVPAFQNVGIQIQQAMNLHKARSIIYFVIALINVILTIPFSLWWNGIGAALATTICMFAGTVLFMNWYYAKRIHLDIAGFWKSICSILPGFLIPILLGVLINRFWTLDSYWDILLSALLIALIYMVSIWFLSMNDYERGLVSSPFKKIAGRLKRRKT